jgi:hypothetical protein
MHALRSVTERADHFDMTAMTDEQNLISLARILQGLQMDFRNQRAGGVNHLQPPCPRFLADRRRNPVRAKDQSAAFGDFCEVFDEAGRGRIREEILRVLSLEDA